MHQNQGRNRLNVVGSVEFEVPKGFIAESPGLASDGDELLTIFL